MNTNCNQTGGASRANYWPDVKSKLYLKFIGGRNIGLLQATREALTGDLNQAIRQILRALRQARTPTTREALRLMVRRYHAESPFSDGIFAGPDVRGYFLYTPPDVLPPVVDGFLIASLNLVPFFRVHTDGDLSSLFVGDVLPKFPELPEPITILWSAESGTTPVRN